MLSTYSALGESWASSNGSVANDEKGDIIPSPSCSHIATGWWFFTTHVVQTLVTSQIGNLPQLRGENKNTWNQNLACDLQGFFQHGVLAAWIHNYRASGACACWAIHYTKQRRKKLSNFPKSMSEILLGVRCHTSCHGTHAQDRGNGWQLRLKATSFFAKACDMRRKAFHP